MAALLALLFLFLWIPAASMLSGVAFESLWYWFAVPLGAPDITITHAMGLALIVRFLTFKKNDDKDDKDYDAQKLVGLVFNHLAFIGMFLLFGYIIKSCM